uniref:DUF559 domain-containing protein n=1 Tax=viral metagenome TaxID=1070528 RepID=A0A6M3KU88_9ZZZZ
MEDYVICKICGWKGKQITTGHLKEHSIKANDYKTMFPNAEMTCLTTKRRMSKMAKTRPPQTEEKKKRISESMKRIYRQTNFPLKNKNENQSGEDNHFYGETHSKENKQKLSQSSTKWLKNAYQNGDKISPFKYLGQGKGMSQYETEVYRLLKPLGFVYDYPVPFSKGRYLIDFAHLERKIGIELDSKLHDSTSDRDERKDKYLRDKGWKIYRIKMDMKNPIDFAEEVLKYIKNLI